MPDNDMNISKHMKKNSNTVKKSSKFCNIKWNGR